MLVIAEAVVGRLQEMADIMEQRGNHQRLIGALGLRQRRRLQHMRQHGHALAIGLVAMLGEQRLDFRNDAAQSRASSDRSLLSRLSLSA